MKYLNNITSIFILAFVIMFTGFFTTAPVYAVESNLDVTFQETPLFDEANFLPGNEVARTVSVTNNSDSIQTVIVESINANDADGLGDELNLVIKEGATTLYDNTLGTFLRAGEVTLSTLSSSASTTYSFGVTFNGDAENDTQGTTLGFDLCVGFEGGNTHCGDTVTGGEGDQDDDTSGGIIDEDVGGGDSGGGGSGNGGASSPGTGSGGGGGGQNITLVITNEAVLNVNIVDGKAVITWNTNHLVTSQVVYGPESREDEPFPFPYSINLTVDPYFGYPFGTVEDPNKVTSHSVELIDLVPGETYRFRVVSRASPPTVSFEHTFTFVEGASGPLSYLSYGEDDSGSSGEEIVVKNGVDFSQINNNIAVNVGAPKEVFAGGIEGGGVGIPGPENIAEEELVDEIIKDIVSTNTATALFGYPDSLSDWLKYILSFVFIVIIIYLVASRRRKREK